MTECEFRRELVLYAEGLPGGARQRQDVERHISECELCRRELAEVNLVRTMLADPELFAPPRDYAWQVLPRTVAARAAEPARIRSLPERFWMLATAATLVLSVALPWLAQRAPRSPQAPGLALERVAPGNYRFVDRIQTAYAREATTEYLAGCQDVLLNVVRAEKSCDGQGYDVSFEVRRARELLARKRLLDPELGAPDVARAKGLCDELEHFLVNLSTSEKCETPDNVRHMEKFIQRQQLLLRINVLQSELS